ncbi:MAG: hypothetical protein JW783_11525 [Bacteroidales bacterium]|nr:hypothetical protein [Bacteroidales bacterium]MBN2749838.1 hypothetical protein [Bacteroidales bacterium]
MRTVQILGITSILLFSMCKAPQKAQNENTETSSYLDKKEEPLLKGNPPKAMAQAIVYKTRSSYNNLVPVTLNEARNAIVSYPAPTDIYYKGELAKPTILANGYLLDNRGVNPNTAFLGISYEEYSKLSDITSEFLWQNIIDATPLVELYHCGNRADFSNEVDELNEIIHGGFKNCKKIAIPPTATLKL